MSTSNAVSPSSLSLALERLAMKHRSRAQELARRTRELETRTLHARRRTWRETKREMLGEMLGPHE